MIIDPTVFLQFIKYALVGGLATLVHIFVFHLSAWKLFPALQAKDHAVRLFRLKIHTINDATRSRNSMIGNVLGFLVANMVAYICNVLFVFQAGKYHVVIEILLFYAVSGVSATIGTVLMGVLIRRFGLLTTHVFVVNIVTSALFNFAMRKFFIFQG